MIIISFYRLTRKCGNYERTATWGRLSHASPLLL